LTQVGSLVLEQNGLNEAEPFFAKGYELAPGMDEGQFRLAMALKRSGRYDEAIGYFNLFRNSYGPFPVDFYLAETLLLKGDKQRAEQYYDSGRKELAANPAALAGFGDFSIIEGAASFYERKGDSRIALELRESIRSKVN
jgi:tetratricopeptide (TPR) repeat protein